MHHPHRRNALLLLAFKLIKYFLLALAGMTITYVAALVLDMPRAAEVIAAFLEQVLGRSLVLLGCIWAIAVINESTRQ